MRSDLGDSAQPGDMSASVVRLIDFSAVVEEKVYVFRFGSLQSLMKAPVRLIPPKHPGTASGYHFQVHSTSMQRQFSLLIGSSLQITPIERTCSLSYS